MIQPNSLIFTHMGRKEGNILFNDALNTFYIRLYMVKDHSDSDEETRCRHMGYSFRLAARVILYAPSHRQDGTYIGLCYTSRYTLILHSINMSTISPQRGGIHILLYTCRVESRKQLAGTNGRRVYGTIRDSSILFPQFPRHPLKPNNPNKCL